MRVLFVLFAAMSLISCSAKPTYPKERLAESLTSILASEGVQGSIRFIAHTLAVQLTYPGALVASEGQLALGPEFDEVSRKVLGGIHRVLLSSDADVRFYVVLLSDPAAPGAYVTLVRYVDDVRRAYANMLDTPEMFARTIFEVTMSPQQAVSIDQYVPRDIRLEEFLSWQLARRIQHALMDAFEVSGVANVGRCTGEFRNGEFVFTLDIAPLGEQTLDEPTMRTIYQLSSTVIAKVLSSYSFNSFDTVRLIHPLSGRNLVLPKGRLELLR
jgi:hypothetical protein